MAGRQKLKKFCRIHLWVEAQDDELATAIRNLCMEGHLSGRSGVTFLYPDKKARAEIVSLTYSEPDQAVKILESLILPRCIKTASEFRSGDVGSKLGVALEVEKVTGSEVTLKGGAVLVPATDFVPLRKDNLAVWKVKSGTVPTTGPEYKWRNARQKGPVGGGEGANAFRTALAMGVEEAFSSCMVLNGCRSQHPYLASVLGLLAHLEKTAPDELAKVLPVLDRDPMASFYLLVEPYKGLPGQEGPNSSDFLLAGSTIKDWDGKTAPNGPQSLEYFFGSSVPGKELASAQDRQDVGRAVVPKVYSDPGGVRQAVDTIRSNLLSKGSVSLGQKVCGQYDSFAAGNNVGSVQPVLPDATLQALAQGKKLWQDQVRFTIDSINAQMQGSYNPQDFKDLLEFVRDTMPGNDYAKECLLTSAVGGESVDVAPKSRIIALGTFINNTNFMYFPTPNEVIGGYWGGADQSPFSGIPPYNAERNKADRLAKMMPEAAAVPPCVIAFIQLDRGQTQLPGA